MNIAEFAITKKVTTWLLVIIMVGGGLLSSLLIIPSIAYWGEGRPPLYPELVLSISEMTASQIWTRYVRYIGAGAVAAAGIITLARSLPVMIASFRIGAHELKGRVDAEVTGAIAAGEVVAAKAMTPRTIPRTDRDLPLKAVGIGVLIIGLVLTFVPVSVP